MLRVKKKGLSLFPPPGLGLFHQQTKVLSCSISSRSASSLAQFPSARALCSPSTPLIPSRQMLSSLGSLAPSADGASLGRHLLDCSLWSLPLAARLSETKQSCVVCILTQRRARRGSAFLAWVSYSFPFPSSPHHHTQEINPPVLGAFVSRKAGDTCLYVA